MDLHVMAKAKYFDKSECDESEKSLFVVSNWWFNIVGTPFYKGGVWVFKIFKKKGGGGSGFFHKIRGVGKIWGLFLKRGYHLFSY